MKLFYSLLILLVRARLLGDVYKRWGQPALIGESCAGIVVSLMRHLACGDDKRAFHVRYWNVT